MIQDGYEMVARGVFSDLVWVLLHLHAVLGQIDQWARQFHDRGPLLLPSLSVLWLVWPSDWCLGGIDRVAGSISLLNDLFTLWTCLLISSLCFAFVVLGWNYYRTLFRFLFGVRFIWLYRVVFVLMVLLEDLSRVGYGLDYRCVNAWWLCQTLPGIIAVVAETKV